MDRARQRKALTTEAQRSQRKGLCATMSACPRLLCRCASMRSTTSAQSATPGGGGGVGVTAIVTPIHAQQFLRRSLRMWLVTWLAEAAVAAVIGFGTMAV